MHEGVRGMRTAVLAVLLAAALAATGCGGGGGTSTSTAPTTRSAAAVNGEKSIEEFGSEAEGSARAALLTAFTGYLDAIAARDYAAACPHLAATVRSSLEQFAPPRLRAKGCAAILPKLLASTAPAIARQQAAGRIVKVRIEGDRAFVVFHAPGAKLNQMPMAREGGDWKVGLAAASILVPSAATLGER